MNTLWVRLTLAFGLVTATGVLIVALLANRQVSADFRQFLAQDQIQSSPLVARLTDYYAAHGDWSGVESVFASVRGPGGAGMGRGLRRGAPTLTLTDAGGRVVYDGAGAGTPQVAAADLTNAAPITAQDRVVGYLLVRGMAGPSDMPPAAQRYLAQVNLALLQAGLLAGALGVLLGLVIARSVAAPLGRLAAAARQVARGALDQRVPVGGPAELVDAAQAFNAMAADLQQAEQLRRNLVADIAHELRTPLTVIQGNLRAILDEVYPLEQAEIATIYDETLVLSRLVGDLRELAQAEAGQLALTLRPTPVAPLVAGAVAPFAAAAAEQGVTLIADAPDNLPAVVVDPDRIGQVLRNLLANALRHTPRGGTITIAVQRIADCRLQIADCHAAQSPISNPHPAIIFSVRDTAPGIADADLPHVFERFWRADRSRSRDQGGSGLGLAIARQLVEAQGGQIGVESTVGQGSTFWFTLPTTAVSA